jgi:hypothetical protein
MRQDLFLIAPGSHQDYRPHGQNSPCGRFRSPLVAKSRSIITVHDVMRMICREPLRMCRIQRGTGQHRFVRPVYESTSGPPSVIRVSLLPEERPKLAWIHHKYSPGKAWRPAWRLERGALVSPLEYRTHSGCQNHSDARADRRG